MSAVVAATRRAVRSRSRALITDNDRKILEQEGQQRLFVEVTNPRSVDEWVEVIRADLGRAVEGIIAAGKHLQEAKREVGRGNWLPLLERVGIEARTAQMLMTIAGHPVISNAKHCFAFPPSWGTLAQLARLDDEALEAAIKDGTVRPDMTRKDAMALLPSPEKRDAGPDPVADAGADPVADAVADAVAGADPVADADTAEPAPETREAFMARAAAVARSARYSGDVLDDAMADEAWNAAAAWQYLHRRLRDRHGVEPEPPAVDEEEGLVEDELTPSSIALDLSSVLDRVTELLREHPKQGDLIEAFTGHARTKDLRKAQKRIGKIAEFFTALQAGLATTKPKRGKSKEVEQETTLEKAIETAKEDMEDLMHEVREVVDSAEPPRDQTQRILTLGETADNLESLDWPDPPPALADLKVFYTVPSKVKSRADRAEVAASILEECVDELRDMPDTDERYKEAQAFAQELAAISGGIQDCEFPGMFG
jgi:archaellum component FlaC